MKEKMKEKIKHNGFTEKKCRWKIFERGGKNEERKKKRE